MKVEVPLIDESRLHPTSYAYYYHPAWIYQDSIDYLLASEVECPQAFWGEDACDYALMGMIEGYIPRCDLARMMLAFPRALPIELKGIAV